LDAHAAVAGRNKNGVASNGGLFRDISSLGKPKSVSSNRGALSIRENKSSFTRIMQSKVADGNAKQDAQALEKLRESLENAIKKLKTGTIPEAAALEKSVQEALEDVRLSPKQRTSRLKELLKEAKDLLAAHQTAITFLPRQPGSAGSREAESPARPRESTALPVVSADASRQSSEPRISIVDLRKNAGQGSGSESQGTQQKITSTQTAEKDANPLLLPQQKVFAQRETTDAAGPQKPPQSPIPATPLERLRDMAGSELARTAGIILRDGGGEIRLILKPESLGSVRVRLNLVDNVIDGKIVVDSAAVKHVLEGSIDSLTRALSADGFQTASLQVSVGGGDARGDRQDEEQAARRVESAHGFSSAVPDVERLNGWDELLVNLLA
jgi:flagellar hook-length control protein FliK